MWKRSTPLALLRTIGTEDEIQHIKLVVEVRGILPSEKASKHHERGACSSSVSHTTLEAVDMLGVVGTQQGGGAGCRTGVRRLNDWKHKGKERLETQDANPQPELNVVTEAPCRTGGGRVAAESACR